MRFVCQYVFDIGISRILVRVCSERSFLVTQTCIPGLISVFSLLPFFCLSVRLWRYFSGAAFESMDVSVQYIATVLIIYRSKHS
ncbi:uncharacterized protein BJX67DRAFT_68904 [Aspergillus lucknowensis]|uniref:Uncharacterized protein n=1 Tax=Aspergillus lucknowensis TaxID=176173 RepID=A0ABR4LX03_9EURO